MGEHLLCKQGVVGSNPTVSISLCLRVRGKRRLEPGALPVGGGTSETCFAPRWRSGILEREPGGWRGGMFFHMVKMISCCVCE